MVRQEEPGSAFPPVSAPIPLLLPDAQTQHSNAQHQRRDLYPDMAPPESGPKPRLSIRTCSRLYRMAQPWYGDGKTPGFFPVIPSIKASMVEKRSSACTASAFMIACSTCGGRGTPSSEGFFSVSLWTRMMESGGSSPVTQRYRVAPMAYTSVHGPWFPLLEYCSSGA